MPAPLCTATVDTGPTTRICDRPAGHPDRHRDADGWTWGDPEGDDRAQR